MEEKLVKILNEISNFDYLRMFLEVQKIEECSERTMQYYRVTIEKMLQYIHTQMRKIATEEIRKYLVDTNKLIIAVRLRWIM